MYGMGIESIAKTIHGTKEEAKKILDGFYDGYPKVKQWMDETVQKEKETGYVEDWFGRRRRLPNILLPQYTVRYKNKSEDTSFNPILGCKGISPDTSILKTYEKLCEQTKTFKELDAIKKKALTEGIEVFSNNGDIAEAKRKGVNARIQGGAATMTKIAMINIDKDEELHNLDFHMLMCVHDEILGECPKENADAVAERLTFLMKNCIADHCIVPFKCDAEICDHWYYNDYCAHLQKEMKDIIKEKNCSMDEAFKTMIAEHTESTEEQLKEILLK